MRQQELSAKITICSYDELSEEEKMLVDTAHEILHNAYAPYSHFRVGAAVRLADGRIVTGTNQENASYPIGLCAERVALGAALAAGERKFLAVACVGESADIQMIATISDDIENGFGHISLYYTCDE